jgi:hypothetical protein
MTKRILTASALRADLYNALRLVAEARVALTVTSKYGNVRLIPEDHVVSGMTTLLRNVASRNWGWYSNEEPRMHIQTVDLKKNDVKVWLENKGERTFELAGGKISKKELGVLSREVAQDRAFLDKRWVDFMLSQQWLEVTVVNGVAKLLVYPGTHNEYTRTVDLKKRLPGLVDWNKEGKSVIVDFDREAAGLRVGTKKTPPDLRNKFELAPILFGRNPAEF